MANHTTDAEKAGAARWLIVAGGAAIALSIAIFRADEFLTGGPARDKVENHQLGILRSAQTGLTGRVTDLRQTRELTEKSGAASAVEETKHDGEHHEH